MDSHERPLNRNTATQRAINLGIGTIQRDPPTIVIDIVHPWALCGSALLIAALIVALAALPATQRTLTPLGAATAGVIIAVAVLLPFNPRKHGLWALPLTAICLVSAELTGLSTPAMTPVFVLALWMTGLAVTCSCPWPQSVAASAMAIISSLAVGSIGALSPIAWLFVILGLGAAMLALGLLQQTGHRRSLSNDERETLNARIALLQHSNQLAIELHDTLSNDLTDISSVARQHPHDPDWQHVFERSQQAFREVHGIIDMLSTDARRAAAIVPDANRTAPQTPEPADTVLARITARVNDVHDTLAAAGYHGTVKILGIATVVASQAEREALSLLCEIGTNIQRHAAPGDDVYLICVNLSPEYIELRETNDLPDHLGHEQVAGLSEAERSGRGLAMHRRAIAELGGECRTRMDEGLWMIYAQIPWRA